MGIVATAVSQTEDLHLKRDLILQRRVEQRRQTYFLKSSEEFLNYNIFE